MSMSSENDKPSGDSYRRDVQGLRAIAVGLVILYHFNFLSTTGGYVGVDVFFVISGFVIAGVVLREVRGTGRLSLATFYGRRARRILPASTLTIVATVIASLILFGRLGTYDVAHDAVAASLFAANFHFASSNVNYFAASQPPSPILHFWSLAVEEQFYFVFPSIVAVVAIAGIRLRRRLFELIALIVVASFAWSVHANAASPLTAYYQIASRAWELGVGVLCALVVHRFGHLRAWISTSATWLGVCLIVASAWGFDAASASNSWLMLIPVLGTAVIILGGTAPAQYSARAPLSSAGMVLAGDLSYSLYLWHFPVIALATRQLGAPPSTAVSIGLLALVVALAWLSYRYVENRLRSAKFFTRSASKSLTLGAACVTIAVVSALIPIAEVPSRASVKVVATPHLSLLKQEIVAATILKVMPARTDPGLVLELDSRYFAEPSFLTYCVPSNVQTTVRLCEYGDRSASRTVVLYGNSQAQMWVPALDLLGQRNHFKVIPIAKPACGVFYLHGYIDPNGHYSDVCWRFAHWAVSAMNSMRPTTVVIAATLGNLLRPGADPHALGPDGRLPSSLTTPPNPAQSAVGLSRLVAALAPSRAKIVLLGNIGVPHTPGSRYPGNTTPNGCLLANLSDIQRCAVPTPTVATSNNRKALVYAAQQAKIAFIDINSLLCANGTCPPVINRILVHFDKLHLSAPYARFVAASLGELLRGKIPAP